MHHHPFAGCIQVSQATRDLLAGHTFSATGGVEVKGKVGNQGYIVIQYIRV